MGISMDRSKLIKTLYVAFFVSFSAQINFSIFTGGFIVAMSSITMAIFLYCYTDLSSTYIICLSGVASPSIRILVDVIRGTGLGEALYYDIPDMAFFFTYALVFNLIYKYLIRKPISLSNFYLPVFFSDFISNLMELTCRSLLAWDSLFTSEILTNLFVIAICRTGIIMAVALGIETYGNLIISQEREKEYRKLLTQAATISGEIRVMKKNIGDVEKVMKQAYDLYYDLKKQDQDEKTINTALSIAKNTHELKSDYGNVIDVLNEEFFDELEGERLAIREILELEKANVLAMARKNGFGGDISLKIKQDFYAKDSFKMMSVIRNLLTNSIEAIGASHGIVRVTVTLEHEEGKDYHVIKVWDNGPGIPKEDMGNVFMEGYSTKFNPATGTIQRGFGLCLVKDFVENEMGGKLKLESKEGEFTRFIIMLPREDKHAILHS